MKNWLIPSIINISDKFEPHFFPLENFFTHWNIIIVLLFYRHIYKPVTYGREQYQRQNADTKQETTQTPTTTTTQVTTKMITMKKQLFETKTQKSRTIRNK
jgi:hypothetical protein